MNKTILSALGIALLLPAGAMAQSAIDAANITPTQLRGTARFVAMGGAFTSLGGDLSSMAQNPAGIGIYRKSDVGLTFDVSFRSYKTSTDYGSYKQNHTKAFFDNFGYVGVVPLSGAMSSFSWGVSYNRLNSFDRRFNGYNRPTGTSLSNYIASYTNGVNSSEMLFNKDQNYNPYLDSSVDWLSILAYNSELISNTNSNTDYAGLFQNGTEGDAMYDVREWGYTDEYNIDFAGNVSDILFWGFGIGVVDMAYHRETNYSESMAGAYIYNNNTNGFSNGNAGFNLYNYKRTTGTGANLKFGLIVRPIEELRIGLAVHTPTWLHLTQQGYGEVDANFTPDGTQDTHSTSEYTDDFDYDWRLNTPWRIMVGASTVIAGQAILSIDYERVAYNDMKMKYQSYNDSWGGSFVEDKEGNADIKSYYKASDIIRIGAEYRVTPSFSVRAGYNMQKSNSREDVNSREIYTAGTDPSYSFDKNTQNICFGVGYRYKGWYIDLAYQHTNSKSTFHAYTPFAGLKTPSASRSDNYNNIVVSTGIRF